MALRRAALACTALWLGLGGGGCYEGFDPLDPEVLAEVMRSRGDAKGGDHSGIYLGRFEALECGCSEVDAEYDLTMCTLIEQAEAIGLSALLDVQLVQADGTVRIQALSLGSQLESSALLLPVLYGPIHADGRLSAGGVLQADTVFIQGQVLGRFDGTLDGPPGAATLELEYQQRYVLDLFGSDDVIGFYGEDVLLQSFDCRERIGLTLGWFASPDALPPGGGESDGDEPNGGDTDGEPFPGG